MRAKVWKGSLSQRWHYCLWGPDLPERFVPKDNQHATQREAIDAACAELRKRARKAERPESMVDKINRISNQAGLTMGPAMGPIIFHQESPRPPEHHHRWAWAMRTDGTTVQRCYDCGRSRA